MISVGFDEPFGVASRALEEAVEKAGGCVMPRRITIDPCEDIVDRADTLASAEIDEAIGLLVEDGILAPDWSAAYSGPLTSPDALHRAAVKFGWAIGHGEKLASRLAPDQQVEFAFDRTAQPATALEHLFLATELHRRGLKPGILTLRLPGTWEPAMDFDGEVAQVGNALAEHAAVARSSGSHRLGIRHAADKFSILPVLGRGRGDLLHLDLSGASWLEAMRTLSRVGPSLFREVLACAQEHFALDASGHCHFTTEEDVRSLPECDDGALEQLFLDDPRGRQLLHCTRSSILGEAALRERLTGAIAAHAELYSALAAQCVERHLSLLHAAA